MSGFLTPEEKTLFLCDLLVLSPQPEEQGAQLGI